MHTLQSFMSSAHKTILDALASVLSGKRYSARREADFGYYLALDLCFVFLRYLALFSLVLAGIVLLLPAGEGLMQGFMR